MIRNYLGLIAAFSLVAPAAGCTIESKSVGNETDSESGGSSGDGGSSTTNPMGPCMDGETMQNECNTCECVDGQWLCTDEACAYDPCEGKVCGETCSVCPPNDPMCVEPAVIKVCDDNMVCVDDDGEVCMTGAVFQGFHNTLDLSLGCSDISLAGHNIAGTLVIDFRTTSQILQGITDSGMPLGQDYDINDPLIMLEVRAGSDLSGPLCNDFIEMPPVVAETWEPVSGTIRLDVSVPNMEGLADATATLTNVVLQRQGGTDQVTIDSYIMGEQVGWFPG